MEHIDTILTILALLLVCIVYQLTLINGAIKKFIYEYETENHAKEIEANNRIDRIVSEIQILKSYLNN